MQDNGRDPEDYTEEWAAQQPWRWALAIVVILLFVGTGAQVIPPALAFLLVAVLIAVGYLSGIGRCPACGGYPGKYATFCKNCGARLRDD